MKKANEMKEIAEKVVKERENQRRAVFDNYLETKIMKLIEMNAKNGMFYCYLENVEIVEAIGNDGFDHILEEVRKNGYETEVSEDTKGIFIKW